MYLNRIGIEYELFYFLNCELRNNLPDIRTYMLECFYKFCICLALVLYILHLETFLIGRI